MPVDLQGHDLPIAFEARPWARLLEPELVPVRGATSMRDLHSPVLIVVKGLMFLGLALTAGSWLLLESPSWARTAMVLLLVWSSCRFYYFLFYVLKKYVDPRLRYSGLWALTRRAAGRN